MYKIKSKIWFESDTGPFLATGRINLLSKIDEFGSISKAASSMNMSYKKAWGLVDSMNTQSNVPLVTRSTGGVNGGGTILTEEGKRMIVFFEEMNRKCQDFLDKELEKEAIQKK